MKKFFFCFLSIALTLPFFGCQKLADDAQKSYQNASQQVENVKNSAIETKNKIDQKVEQVQKVQQDIKKLSE